MKCPALVLQLLYLKIVKRRQDIGMTVNGVCKHQSSLPLQCDMNLAVRRRLARHHAFRLQHLSCLYGISNITRQGISGSESVAISWHASLNTAEDRHNGEAPDIPLLRKMPE